MNHRISLLALALSILSIAYAAWVHHRSESIAERAVLEREARLVRHLTPRFRDIYIGFGIPADKIPATPKTLEELLIPFEEETMAILPAKSSP